MRKRPSIVFLLLSFLLLILLVVDICVGSIFIPFYRLWSLDGVWEQIVWQLRVPKAITAILAGSALSVAGLMMQTLFRNPLAGPYILGVSSGASLGVALATMCASSIPLLAMGVVPSAIIGATLVLLLVVGMSRKIESQVSLLIVGMMLGSMAGAIVNVIQNFSNPDALKLFIVWTLGSLSNVGWNQLVVLLPVLLFSSVLVMYLIKPLNGLLLGENYARGLGIHVERTRMLIVMATGLLAGSVTAYCGPIAFIGVAVPHIARGLFATSNHRITVPATALLGALLLLICDILCSFSTYPLPISTVSALFGAPIIIWILLKK